MNWISDRIAISDLNDAINPELIKTEGINYIVSVQKTYINLSSIHGHDGITYFWMPLGFGQEEDGHFNYNVDILVNKLSKWDKTPNKILIHCMGGIDRSPFVVALYLFRHKTGCLGNNVFSVDNKEILTNNSFVPFRSLSDAYRFVTGKRPQTFVHLEWDRNTASYDPRRREA